MDVFFADDSTQNGGRKGMDKVIGLGGILVEERALRGLSDRVDAIVSEFGVPRGEELKWSPRKGSWIHGNLHGERRTECYAQVLQAASAHNVRAIVTCWDTGRTSLKGKDAFRENVKYLFQSTCATLTGFVSEVAAQSGKSIDKLTASQLLATTQAIETALSCQ
jgi:hypothetical protein